MNDESDRRVEYLDEWDSTLPPEPPRTADRRLLLPFALVVVGAIIVALVLGGAGRGLFGPVAPKLPVVTGPTNNPATPYQPVDVASENAFTPAPPNDDVEAQPLIVTLEQTLPKTSDGILSFKVSVCVNSASAGGGKVRISRDSWFLGFASTGSSGPARDRALVTPAFPVEGLYGKGQCATGYVTFAKGEESPSSISYSDGRFGWTWVF